MCSLDKVEVSVLHRRNTYYSIPSLNIGFVVEINAFHVLARFLLCPRRVKDSQQVRFCYDVGALEGNFLIWPSLGIGTL